MDQTFDWNDISIGNNSNSNSHYFRKHFVNILFDFFSNHIPLFITDIKTPVRKIGKENNINNSNEQNNKQVDKIVKQILNKSDPTSSSQQQIQQPFISPDVPPPQNSNTTNSSAPINRMALRLQQQPIGSRPPTANSNISDVQPFRVSQYSKIYEEKKKRQAALREAEEKRKREFRSKPAPKFHQHHRKLEEQIEQYRRPIVVPSPPKAYERSMKMQEMHKQKVFKILVKLLIF